MSSILAKISVNEEFEIPNKIPIQISIFSANNLTARICAIVT